MRTIYPSYQAEAASTAYPFDAQATRTNGRVVLDDDIFVDGRLFPPDGRADVYLASIAVGDEVVLSLADSSGSLGSAVFTRSDPPEYVTFYNDEGTYLGLLQGYTYRDGVSSPIQRGLSKIAGWSDGTYTFTFDQTRFAATVVVPQPQSCVRAIVLDSGATFFGDVYLVGENGVQLTNPGRIALSSSSGAYSDEMFVRVDVVGDPLFVRKGCTEQGQAELQDTFVESLVLGGTTITPGATGNVTIFVGTDSLTTRPALRITPVANGLQIGFVGG